MRHFIAIFVLACLLIPVRAQAAKPNFVIIFTDDQGYQDLGCFGSPNIKTPNIDQMAAEGMKLTSFYSQTVCGPARAALMTGCYPMRVARNDKGIAPAPKLSLSEVTVAEVLKEQGYATGVFGKWDLAGHHQTSFNYDLGPIHQGFDTAFWTASSNDATVHLLRQDRMVEAHADMSQLSRRYTDEAIAFIRENSDQPFFVYVAHTMPHTKLAVAPPFKGKSERGLYGDVIEEIDFHVGRLLDAIKSAGVDDETYVIFTSDNGPWWFRHEKGGCALPLRGAKTSTYEGGVRVPFVVRAPGRVPAGKESAAVTATIDILPTLAALAGGEVPQDRIIDGVDISELWHGGAETGDRAYYYYGHTMLRGVRKGKWKLHVPHIAADEGTKMMTKWLPMVAPEDRPMLKKSVLYDLENDIAETTDVSAQFPEVVRELELLVEQMRKEVGDSAGRGEKARPVGDEPYHTTGNRHAVAIRKKRNKR